MEYAYAATKVQSRSVGEELEIIPNTFKQVMTQLVKLEWKAISDKEVASLNKNNVYTLLPAIYVPTGHKIVGSRWVYKGQGQQLAQGKSRCVGVGAITRR